jgi:hypothetical protein
MNRKNFRIEFVVLLILCIGGCSLFMTKVFQNFPNSLISQKNDTQIRSPKSAASNWVPNGELLITASGTQDGQQW